MTRRKEIIWNIAVISRRRGGGNGESEFVERRGRSCGTGGRFIRVAGLLAAGVTHHDRAIQLLISDGVISTATDRYQGNYSFHFNSIYFTNFTINFHFDLEMGTIELEASQVVERSSARIRIRRRFYTRFLHSVGYFFFVLVVQTNFSFAV